ncbi:MAG: hypothetical protein IJ733_18720, partial [Lachnospiraceae bacterium]|nr:hypothetical protein [Lachnospiraceae bacterium]
MRKAIIRGTGSGGERTTAYINANNAVFDVEIIGYSDGDPQKWGGYFLDKRIYSPGELENLDYDILVIGSGMYHEIRKELLGSGVPEDKVYSWHELYTEYQYQKKYGCTGKKKRSGDPLSDLVVYTANMGNYDELCDPLYVDDKIQYV